MFKDTFKKNSPYILFLISVAVMETGYGMYKGILDNYLANIVGMNEFDKGLSEFFREMPGILLILVLAMFFTMSAEGLFKMGGVVMVIGIALHAILPADKMLVIIAMFIYSLGEHIQYGMRNTIAIEYSVPGKGGQGQGYMRSVTEIGMLIGYAVVAIVFSILTKSQPFRPIFAIATILTLGSLLVSLGLSSKSETDKSKSRFYFRKKFKKYYMLEVFYGARKQVFMTFGPYVLILFYGADTAIISILYAVSAIACSTLAPIVGKIIDKAGYRIVMIMDTIILVVVCFFYGFAHHIFPEKLAFIVCCINYVLDSIISLASMASNVYVQDISENAEECRATISTGISVNHLISILIALFGGWIWKTLGIEVLFILSAILGLCNSAYAASIPKKNIPKKNKLTPTT